MKCHWAGVAEIAAAIPLGIAGVFAWRARRKETIYLAGLVGGASSVMALLLPTVLIGTCANESMFCNLLMRPILLFAGILATVASIGLFFVARGRELPVAQAVA